MSTQTFVLPDVGEGLTEAEIVEKYEANARLAVDAARAEAVKQAVLGMAESDGRALAAALAG